MSSESENVSSIDRKLFCNVDSTSLLFSLMIERRRGGLMVSALHSGPSGGVGILLVASCYRNQREAL